MNMSFKWSRLEALSTLELYEIIKAREAVFVVEQNCPYQETDEKDLKAWHLMATMEGELAAYARVVDPGAKFAEPSIGRVMVVEKFRKKNIGRTLMDEAIRFSETTFPGATIRISAQVYLKKFYESLGFLASSEQYDEDGIPHIEMIRPTH